MQKILYQYIVLPIAKILLTSDGNFLTGLYFVGQKHQPIPNDQYYQHQQLEIFDSTHRELTSYINGTLKNFTISYYLIGTEFQKKIWTLLGNIPYGEVISYKEVASLTGSLSSVRAVANAIGHNNLSIIIPCHRVIGSNGKLTGYAAGLEMKRKLLDLESYRLANGLAMVRKI